MDYNNSLKKVVLQAFVFFIVAVGIEIALCAAVVVFALPLDLVRFFIWVLWFAMAFVAWARSSLGGQKPTPSPLEYFVYLFLVACYAGVAFSIPHFFFQAFRVPSGAMEPTILIGDKLVVKKFHIQIQRGDIISFQAPPAAVKVDAKEANEIFLKRVIGVPCDVIEIRNKQLILNGQPLSEAYTIHSDSMTYPTGVLSMTPNYQSRWESGDFAQLTRHEIGDNFGPVRVPDNTYFILGDNRDGSFDSRFWGPLPKELVTGKAIRVYSPPSHARQL